jgi:hypothetical protein
MFSCPKCGKSDSSHDGSQYCGPCEDQYHREQAEENERIIRDLQDAMASCSCAEGDCHPCQWNRVRVLSLQGKNLEAAMILNE